MKNVLSRMLKRANNALFSPLKSKKELISERSDKMDPNNKEIEMKPLIISETGREVHDDGFEHRSSAEISNPVKKLIIEK